MSKGPGRIERAIRELFASNPADAFTTEELIAVAFPGICPEKKHRVSVLRAAHRIVDTDPNWCIGRVVNARGRLQIFFNADNIESYGLMRWMVIVGSTKPRYGRFTTFGKSKEELRVELRGEYSYLIAYNSCWHKDVEIHRALREGNELRANKLERERDEAYDRITAIHVYLINLRALRRGL